VPLVQTIPLPQPGVALRAWQERDIERLAELANDERIGRWMSDTWPMPYTRDDAAWWVGRGQHERGSSWAVSCGEEVIGGVGLRPEAGFKRCNVEVGWWLAPAFWGQGVATAAARVMVALSFADKDVHRVYAPVHAGNERSARVAVKAGMRLESIQPHSAYKQGRVITRHLYACYRADGDVPTSAESLARMGPARHGGEH
jgi:[ribosomal protein S5]-alanine N-acetyltransferase